MQIQGKDRAAVAEAGRRLGLDGTYIPRSYIEQVTTHHFTSLHLTPLHSTSLHPTLSRFISLMVCDSHVMSASLMSTFYSITSDWGACAKIWTQPPVVPGSRMCAAHCCVGIALRTAQANTTQGCPKGLFAACTPDQLSLGGP